MAQSLLLKTNTRNYAREEGNKLVDDSISASFPLPQHFGNGLVLEMTKSPFK